MSTLSKASLGSPQRIQGLVGDHSHRIRLMEQGIIRGRSITVIRKGNPYICDVSGFRLSLSSDLVEQILVEDGGVQEMVQA